MDGNHVSNWESILSKLEIDEDKILYLWRGWHVQPEQVNIPYHGYGEFTFDRKHTHDYITANGESKYWDVNEFDPKLTTIIALVLLDTDFSRAFKS